MKTIVKITVAAAALGIVGLAATPKAAAYNKSRYVYQHDWAIFQDGDVAGYISNNTSTGIFGTYYSTPQLIQYQYLFGYQCNNMPYQAPPTTGVTTVRDWSTNYNCPGGGTISWSIGHLWAPY